MIVEGLTAAQREKYANTKNMAETNIDDINKFEKPVEDKTSFFSDMNKSDFDELDDKEM